jgi:hypothetical protein
MTVIRMSRLLVVTAGAAVALMIATGTAGATTGSSSPAPLCGAFNMVEASPTFYANAVSGGMDIAMTVDTLHGNGANGNAGMFGAVATSSQAHSPSCTGG